MKCQYCGADLQDTDTFCVACGRKVERREKTPRICPNCGAVLRDGTSFCHKCGTRVEDLNRMQRRHPEDEELDEEEIDEEDLNEEYDEDDDVDDDEDDDDEDDDEEDDDEEDDDEEDDEESSVVGKIMILIGIIIVLVGVIAGFLYWKSLSSSGDSAAETTTQSTEAASAANSNGTAQAGETKGQVEVVSPVNIRSEANKNSQKLGQASAGDVLEYYDTDGSWYHIKTADGTVGYVSAKYVKEK